MAYASAQDWLDTEADQSHLADPERSGTADLALIDRAIELASNEMDGWLAARYETPVSDLKSLPVLNAHVIAIATHQMARTSGAVTEEIRKRYEDSIAYLRAVSQGKADLPRTPPPASDAESASGSGEIIISAPERLFTRDSLKGL